MFAVSLLALCAIQTFAQMPQIPQAPTDSAVRIGTLPNGITYYIRHNEYPKGQVDFHIAQKVGAVQEDASQNGLAHFLEHMCFNGTKNFPNKTMLTWLETVGVKFGYNVNAHTGTDQTVYDITNVPVARESVVDSCLLILHDWADALTLDPREIDKERGVIHEEWRLSNNAFMRILSKYGSEFYPNTQYATHDVIGSMDIIDHFPAKTLRDYYEKWYRPDLQGIIVVGDIDINKIEERIKTIFTPITMPKNPAAFEYQKVGDNDAPIIVCEKDKEMPYELIMLSVKFDLLPREMRNTDAMFVTDYAYNMLSSMLNQRLTEIMLKPNAPFGNCSSSVGQYLMAKVKGSFTLESIVNDKGYDVALKAMLTELKRIADHGFTATEYDRARTEYMSQLEKAYNDREKQKNNSYAQEYIEHFLDNTAIPGIEYEYNKMKQLTPMIPVDAINANAKQLFGGKNLVVLATCPDKEGNTLPAKEEILNVIKETAASTVEAYKDNVITEPLMSQLPKPGKIVSEKENKIFGCTELTLSNGVKVMLKTTNFKDNEICMKASSEGGASLYPAKDYPTIAMQQHVWGSLGIGKFSYTDLQKLLSGKQVGVTPFISDYSEGMNGTSTVKDLETMMQLLYLNFTQPRYDKQAFETVKAAILSQLKNMEQNPQYVYSDSLTQILYNHNPKAMILSVKMASKMDYDRMVQIYKERFANAADFSFFFSGSFDMATMKKLVEQYIATLPAIGKKEKAANDGKSYASGIVNKEFARKSENNQAFLGIVWSGKLPYTQQNKIKASIAGQLMANNLLNSVREDEGAAYSPYSQGEVERTFEDIFTIQTVFGLNPDKHTSSEKLTIASLENLAKNIPEAELNKMKEYMLKKADENAKDNNYWIRAMRDWKENGVDNVTGYKEYIQKLTPKEMQEFIASLLKQGNRCKILMMPEKK